MPSIVKQSMKPVVRKAKTSSSIVDRIVDVGDVPETGIKFLIYGPSGTGKTTLACTFPKPLLLIRPESVEDGSMSVRTVKGIEVTPYLESPDQVTELVEYQRESGRYKTMVLDGVPKFQDLVLKKVVGLKEVPAQLSWGIATQQDWGTVANELKEQLRRLLRLADLGCNVVILGGERALNVDGDNEARILAPSVMIALTPSSMGWLHEVCDYNVRTFIRREVVTKTVEINKKQVTRTSPGEGYEYCLRTGPDDVYQTKFRVPKGIKLPAVVVDPDYTKLIHLIRGGK